jgi:hypothetical protein
MATVREYPVLACRDAINAIVQADADLGPEFSFTNSKTKETEYRIFKRPLNQTAIKGTAFATYFLNETKWNESLGKRIPQFYCEIATQHADLETAIDNGWKIAMNLIETLSENPSLNKTCGYHRFLGTDCVEPNAGSMWTHITILFLEIYPLGSFPAS